MMIMIVIYCGKNTFRHKLKRRTYFVYVCMYTASLQQLDFGESKNAILIKMLW